MKPEWVGEYFVMLFSLLIPVYQVEKYVRQCIDSILNQSEQDFEIVLADDGSTDSSGAICDEYADRYPSRVKVFHKENEGPLLTRRRLLERASGQFVLFADSDDELEENALSALKTVIGKTDADMIITI